MIDKNNYLDELFDILNEKNVELEARLPHFWHQMYFRMLIATETDRSRLNTVSINQAEKDMAESFFNYNRARNKYISQQTWPNYYQWLKENRFNGQSSEEMLEQLRPKR